MSYERIILVYFVHHISPDNSVNAYIFRYMLRFYSEIVDPCSPKRSEILRSAEV